MGYVDFGWIFIYIFVFGISDLVIKQYINNDSYKIIYYLIIGLIGYYLLTKNNYL